MAEEYTALFENDSIKVLKETITLHSSGATLVSFWIWDKRDKINIAMNAKTEIEAYQMALTSRVDWLDDYKNRFRKLHEKVIKSFEIFEDELKDHYGLFED